LTLALRRSQASAFLSGAARHAPRPGPVVLLLSPDLQVRGQTPRTQDYLRVLVPPSARVHLSEGLWVTLRAARIGDTGPVRERDIAVTIEETSPPERVALFARAFGLSARENELLGHLVSGTDTRDSRAGCSFRAHSAGSPEIDLREDLRTQPPDPAVTCPGHLSTANP
jgi:hypothetical protein